MAAVRDCGFKLVDHSPPYFPDLAPSDYFLFPNMVKHWALSRSRGSGWELLYHGNASAATPMEETTFGQIRPLHHSQHKKLWTFQPMRPRKDRSNVITEKYALIRVTLSFITFCVFIRCTEPTVQLPSASRVQTIAVIVLSAWTLWLLNSQVSQLQEKCFEYYYAVDFCCACSEVIITTLINAKTYKGIIRLTETYLETLCII